MSDVNVKIAVMLKERPRCLRALTTLPLSSVNSQRMSKLTWTGFFPPSDSTPISLMLMTYCGNSASDLSISIPKGERRFNSYVAPLISFQSVGRCWEDIQSQSWEDSVFSTSRKNLCHFRLEPVEYDKFLAEDTFEWLNFYSKGMLVVNVRLLCLKKVSTCLRFFPDLLDLSKDNRPILPCLGWQTSEPIMIQIRFLKKQYKRSLTAQDYFWFEGRLFWRLRHRRQLLHHFPIRKKWSTGSQ